MLKKYPDLKKAVENDKLKKKDIFYYVDKKTKKILFNKSDSTDFSIINFYTSQQSENPPVKSENKIVIKTEGVRKIKIPKID